MSKAQSFGFDVLLTLIAVLLFTQLLYLYSVNQGSSLSLQRRLENNQALLLALKYNNSISLFNSYACNNNLESFEKFNESITYYLKTYVSNREYLFAVNGFVYSSERVGSVCLKRASPVIYSVNSSCNSVLNFEFSIYNKGEKVPC